MDKKFKYQQSSQTSKPTSTDSKKTQDVCSSKLLPKASRRRESAGASSYSKNDQPRKSNAQKTKNFDKRPKPKGHYHGSSKEDSKVVEDESAEIGSVMVQGSKKQNLNHLLNFHYAPRDVQRGWNQGRTYGHNYNRWLPPIQRHKYHKEQFLQANCQFLVTAEGDYSVYLNDPDVLVNWNLIQQIRIHTSDNLSCPICLCPPVAGKMTRCGHVYCWSCVLHYLSLSEKSWSKCPICYDSIYKKDLKSVVQITENVLNIGDYISLRLMRREKSSLIAVPVDDLNSTPPSTFMSITDNYCEQAYSKLLLAHKTDIMDIIDAERVQLQLEMSNDPSSSEIVFIEQALAELLERQEALFKDSNENQDHSKEGNPKENTFEAEFQESIDMIKSNTSNKESLNNDNSSSTNEQTNLDFSQTPSCVSSNTQKFYYFYQAEDGQNIFLHAMNIKMLESQYGSLENSPRKISGRLIEKEVGSFTEELRNRLRYLRHLPITSQFELVEIELQPPIVSKDVLTQFEDQIFLREKKRQRREKEERKREKKIAEEENKRMGKYPKPNVHIESHKHFPQFQPETFEFNIPSPPESTVSSSLASSPSNSAYEDIAASIVTEKANDNWSVRAAEQGPSFAQMLRTRGSKKTVAWPSLNAAQKIESTASSASSHVSNDIDPDLEEYIAPAYNQSWQGFALAEALERAELLNDETCVSNNSGCKKKKKKAKATVLFATNMARAS